MPSPCHIHIEGIQATPPYLNGNEPMYARIVARSSDHCSRMHVVVRAAGPDSPMLSSNEVEVDFSNALAESGIDLGLVVSTFTLPQVGLRCGDALYVEISCVQDPTCTANGWFPIVCKPAPAEGNGGAGGVGGGEDAGGGGTWWPPTRCMFTAAGAAFGLLAALALIALGTGMQNAAMITAAAVLLGTVAISWSLWVFWCAPSLCVRLAVLCWVFKRGFIAAIPVLVVSSSAIIVLVIVGYGATAGLLVHALRVRNCAAPSARRPLTQIPI